MRKLANCKSCNAEIDKNAKTCSNCGAKNKKPFYKRWWFGFIVVVIVIGSFGGNDEEVLSEEEPEGAPVQEESAEVEQEEQRKVIELNEEITSADYTAEILRVIIEEDILTIVFEWENQSDWDPAHFELLGYVTASQNNETLEEVSGDRKHKQIERGKFDRYDLEYKLIDESDISIRVVSVSEYDGSDEEIKVKFE